MWALRLYVYVLLVGLGQCSNILPDENTRTIIGHALDDHHKREDENLKPSAPAIVRTNIVKNDGQDLSVAFIVWDPLQQFPESFQDYFCPACSLEGIQTKVFATTIWNDGSTKKRRPRIIFDIASPVWLIGRIYRCQFNSDHTIVSTHTTVFDTLRKTKTLELELTHKYGYTAALNSFIKSSLLSGLSFIRIQNTIRAVYQAGNTGITESYPKEKLLQEIFLSSFMQEETNIIRYMSGITADEWIAADHTFKTVVNIGYTRKSDNKWIKLYNALFCILNEKGQVLKWQLTKTTKSEEVQEAFRELANRQRRENKMIKAIYVDNCCQMRKILRRFFHHDTLPVKLDLFHAIKRFTDTLPKRGNPFRKSIAKDYSNVFRSVGDYGKKRLTETPSPERITKNIHRFRQKWRGFKYKGKKVLNVKSLLAIENMIKHIKLGCVSLIPKGCGTNKNERLHRKLKKIASKSKMGVKLAYALFSVVFEHLNRELTEEQDNHNEPTEVTEKFGIFDCGEHSYSRNQTDNNDDDLVREINERAIAFDEIGLFFLKGGFEKLVSFQNALLMPNTFRPSLFKNSTEGDLVEERAKTIGCEVLSVEGDGNCFFRALGFQIQNLLQMSKCPETVRNHLHSLGINTLVSIDELIAILRNMVVNEWINNQERYHMASEDTLDFVAEARAFQQSGHFSSALGDAMPLGAANALGIPVVLITGVLNLPVVFITPETSQIMDVPILLAFHNVHYDILITLPAHEIADPSAARVQNTAPKTFCRCGVNFNHKEEKRTFCNNSYEPRSSLKRSYRSRCQCYKNGVPCNNLCKCKSCGNGKQYEAKKKKRLKSTKAHFSRKKRQNLDQTSEEFLNEKGAQVPLGFFSRTEWLILECTLFFFGTLKGDKCSWLPKLTSTFNKASQMSSQRNSKSLPQRSEKDIAKYLLWRDRQKNMLRVTVEQ